MVKYTPDKIRKEMQSSTLLDGGVVTYFEDDRGSISSTVYKPFSGISLVKKEVDMPQFITNWRYGPVEAFAIEYCYEGILEGQIDDDYLHISSGDIIIFRTDPNRRYLHYPVNHYRALQLVIYLEEPSPILDLHLGMANITPELLMKKYLPDDRYYHMLKDTELLKMVFESMLHAPESMKTMYLGIKSLECFVLLASEICVMDEIDKKLTKRLPAHQAKIAKQVYEYTMKHPEERYSIDELAEKFSISPTQLKKSFQVAYGTSMQKFVREQKMKLAAEVLETTDKKVTEVAQMFGYSNASKFAAAFKKVIGEYPKKYSI